VKFLSRYAEPLYSILRFVAGFLFTFHGAQKLFGMFGGNKTEAPLMIFGGVIELVGGLLVALGLLTVPAAFLCSGMMAVAYFKSHFPQGFWPIENKGELAALYCFVFLYIAARGSGVWSLDALFRRRRR
jgi:putative oxidoreductase